MKKLLVVVCAVLMLVGFSVTAYANNVVPVTPNDGSGTITADNHYDFYVTTNDAILGTLIGSSDKPFSDEDMTPLYDWATPESWNYNLTSGQTNYLHVVARNASAQSGFLGQFALTGTNYLFANGSQSLLTNINDWDVRLTSFADTSLTPVSKGTNGVGPWGPISSISSNAVWLWSSSANEPYTTRYFSTPITAAPEPVSSALFLMGAGAMIVRRIRRKA